jgi:hypothetical protein
MSKYFRILQRILLHDLLQIISANFAIFNEHVNTRFQAQRFLYCGVDDFNIRSVMGFKYSLTTVKLVEEMSLVDMLMSYRAGSYVALFSSPC